VHVFAQVCVAVLGGAERVDRRGERRAFAWALAGAWLAAGIVASGTLLLLDLGEDGQRAAAAVLAAGGLGAAGLVGVAG
jgi:hypothetical protein